MRTSVVARKVADGLMSNSTNEWTTLMGNNQRTGYVDAGLEPRLRLAWKYFLGQYVWASAVVAHNRVYIGNRQLVALDLISGKPIWQIDPSLKISASRSNTIQDSQVYKSNENELGIFNTITATYRVLTKLESRGSTPCVDHDSVYWCAIEATAKGSRRGSRLFAIDTSTGEVKWKSEHVYKGPLSFTPTLFANNVYYATPNIFFALDTNSGQVQWQRTFKHPAGEPLTICPTAAIFNDGLIVSIQLDGIYRLQSHTGEMLWRNSMPLGFTTPPAVSPDGWVYVAGDKLYALDAGTGQLRWSAGGFFAHSAPIIVGSLLFVGGGFERAVLAYDRYTGEKVWSYPTGDLVFSTPAYANGHLLIGSHDGYLYCFTSNVVD
jgi:outer membrane protein assembly factor BamB